MILGYIFVFIGTVFLLRNSGMVALSWDIIWPLLLIGIGVYLMEKIHRMHRVFTKTLERFTGTRSR